MRRSCSLKEIKYITINPPTVSVKTVALNVLRRYWGEVCISKRWSLINLDSSNNENLTAIYMLQLLPCMSRFTQRLYQEHESWVCIIAQYSQEYAVISIHESKATVLRFNVNLYVSRLPSQASIYDVTTERICCTNFILTSISVPGLEENAKAVGGSIDKLFSPNEHLARVVLGLSQKLCTCMIITIALDLIISLSQLVSEFRYPTQPNDVIIKPLGEIIN